MKRIFYLLLTILFVLLLTAGFHYNKPQPPAPDLLIAEGYGGPMELSISVSDQGTITELSMVRHNETSSYIDGLTGFLKQFIGLSRHDSFTIGKDIDAISGATISSTAITDAVRNKMYTKQTPDRPEERQPEASPATMIIPLALFILAVIALFARHNALRWAALTGGFVYFGIITHTMLSIVQVAQTGLRHIPSFSHNPLWWALLLAIIGTLIFVRIYCGSLCPFALIQEVLYYLKPHKHPLMEKASPHIDGKARLIKYVLLFLITGTCLILGHAAAANIEPFITLFSGHGSKLALSLLALMLIMAVFNFRFWCKYLCPVGALTSLIAAFSINKIHPNKKCTGCGICTNACPTEAISTDPQGKPVIDPGECIACAKCLRACPENAMTCGCKSYEKK